MKEETKKSLEVLFKDTELVDIDKDYDLETADEFIEYIQERINEDEIIYYHNAMQYLKENDASLKESLEIAEELGYTPKNLSSEILATLLSQRILTDTLEDLRKDIEEIFNNEEAEENNV